MLSLDSIRTGKSLNPPRIIVYGGPGLGKSTFAANAPKPIFIQTEDGLGNLDVAHFPQTKTAEDVDAQLWLLMTEPHDYQTLVFDSLDWYERLLWDKVAKANGVAAIENINWGKGFVLVLNEWQAFLQKINQLSRTRNMGIIYTAHSDVVKFIDPEKGEYNRYGIALHKQAAPLLIEDVDAILFAKKDGVVTTDKTKFGTETKRVIGQGTRTVLTQEKPSATAKSRYSLPLEITVPEGDVTWGAVWTLLAQNVPYYQALTKGEITAPSKADALPA